MNIRKATLDDAILLSKIRKQQLLDEGLSETRDMDGELEDFFKEKLVDHDFLQYIMEDNGTFVSTAAIIYYDFPPSYSNMTGKRAYLTNVYTADKYRRHGFAKIVIEKLLDETAKRNINYIWLGASKMGKHLYESLGFEGPDDLMVLKLEK